MVALCVSCQANLEIRNLRGNLINNDTISGNIAKNKWFYYKTCFNIANDETHTLTVDRSNDRGTIAYWALNQIALQEQEKGKTLKCQFGS